jgi:hypothetical protein
LSGVDSWFMAAVLAAAMLAGWGVGWRWGRRRAKEGHEIPPGKFQDASMALLGLLLAFTFSLALSKYDQLRQKVVADANAIRGFYTCAGLAKEPVRARLQALVRKYVERRLALTSDHPDEERLTQELDELQGMHNQMRALVGEALDAGMAGGVPLVGTFNELTNGHAVRLAALRDRLPDAVVLLLFLSAVACTALVGGHQGAAGEWRPAATVAFVALACLVVWVTLDLNQPYRGLITVSQEPMQRLLSAMER